MKQKSSDGVAVFKRPVQARRAKPDLARDDISAAFAGEENQGPGGMKKTKAAAQSHSTNVKSRKTPQSKLREKKV